MSSSLPTTLAGKAAPGFQSAPVPPVFAGAMPSKFASFPATGPVSAPPVGSFPSQAPAPTETLAQLQKFLSDAKVCVCVCVSIYLHMRVCRCMYLNY